MKKFVEPEIKLVKLLVEDIINTSTEEEEEAPDAGDNGLGWG